LNNKGSSSRYRYDESKNDEDEFDDENYDQEYGIDSSNNNESFQKNQTLILAPEIKQYSKEIERDEKSNIFSNSEARLGNS
jgi:hypothetical protein